MIIPRNTGRKISHGFAIFSLACMLISLVFFLYLFATRGITDVITASLLATTLFFLSCTIVLYLMGKPPQYVLEPWDSLGKTD
ncbi:MAG: hypothetical protein Q8O37_03430 [Sulfuricellaceae bacterium]|nr:hypothetical protein [Sulfuricellaceae bacterium]